MNIKALQMKDQILERRMSDAQELILKNKSELDQSKTILGEMKKT